MKSGHEYELSHEQQEKVLELMSLAKEVSVFEIEGQLFKGNIVEVTKRYVAQNPSAKFWVWLHDNIPMLSAPL